MSLKEGKKEKHRVSEILARLDQIYPDVTCALNHENPYQLLIATILSAQCTDVRVNKVTPALFARYPSPELLAQAESDELQEIIHSTGFFRNKAKNLIAAAKKISNEFDGEVPQKMEKLLELPGVARKTANDNPVKIERDLIRRIPQDHWIRLSHQLIHHGRQVCKARKPRCERCAFVDLCPYFQEFSE
jgi:endonuclease-3